jgi:hypothetical protein
MGMVVDVVEAEVKVEVEVVVVEFSKVGACKTVACAAPAGRVSTTKFDDENDDDDDAWLVLLDSLENAFSK